MFIEGWTVPECRYHFKRLRPPKYGRKGQINFGEGLDWNLNSVEDFNGIAILLTTKKGLFSNSSYLKQAKKSDQ